MPKLDLRGIRERVNAQLRRRQKENPESREITQTDLSRMLTAYGINISQTQLSRYEENPENAPLALLVAWLRCLGTTLDQELMRITPASPSPIDPGRPYQRLRKKLSLLTDYLNHSGIGLRIPPGDADALNNLAALATDLRRKPNLLLSGTFDAGKSTLANWLLGPVGQLPEAYSPTTCLITYLHHIEDRPDWATHTAYFLTQAWDHRRFDDRDHATECIVAAGDWASLRPQVTHDGADPAGRAKYALVFLDSPVLYACNIVDPPGYGNDALSASGSTEGQDSELADIASLSMDVLAFLHVPQGFLETRDIELLRYYLKRLSAQCPQSLISLQGVFLVITHANPSLSDGDDGDIERIRRSAARRIYRLLEPQLAEIGLATGKPISEATIQSRIFTFCKDLPDRQEALRACLATHLKEHLPAAWESRADKQVAEARQHGSDQMRRRMDMLSSALKGKQDAEQMHQRLRAESPEHLAHLHQEESAIVEQIHLYREEHQSSFSNYFKSHVSESALLKLIESRFHDKNAAQKDVPTYLKGLLETQLAAMARDPSEALKVRIDTLLSGLESEVSFSSSEGPSILVPFDVKGAFLGGAVSASAMGALALWASAFPGLGGYAVAAQVLGWVGLGGSAWMTAIAAMGGPITLAIGIGAAIFFCIMGLFGDSWEKRLSRRIVEKFEELKLEQQFGSDIANYWANTEKSFRAGIAAYKQDYLMNLERVRALAEDKIEWDDQKVNSQIRLFEDAQGFFANLPWTPISRQ